MAHDTIFYIYSMSKPITSTAVMMLCEEGLLRMSDKASEFLPELGKPFVMVIRPDGGYDLKPANREITIHDLLTHTGGLSYGFDDTPLDELYRKTFKLLDSEPEQVLENWMQGFARARIPLAFHPGTDFRYSLSIDLLGYIIQLVSGKPLEIFLSERIFEPLGMNDTAFWVPPQKIARLASIYGPASGGGIEAIEPPGRLDMKKPTRNPWGGGGLASTITDYFRFSQMLLSGGKLDGVRLLGRKTVEWMMQNHLPDGVHPLGQLNNGFGIGGSVLLHPGLSQSPGAPGIFGWGGLANTIFWIDPKEELVCILMLQYVPAFTIPIDEEFILMAYQAIE